MIEELGVNIKIPRQDSRQTKRQNYFDADIFRVWTFGKESFHFIHIQALGSVNGDIDFRFSKKILKNVMLNVFLLNSIGKSWKTIRCGRY
jgi:hypothetical protein